MGKDVEGSSCDLTQFAYGTSSVLRGGFGAWDLKPTSHEYGTPLWSRGQSSWLQIQRSGFDSRRYHIF
jgi:hypothetical protein